MQLRLLFAGLLLCHLLVAQTPLELWNDLSAKRAKLPSFHQEFDVSRSFKLPNHTQDSKSQLFLDQSKDQWRERTVAGYGNHLTIFDGTTLYYMEEGGDEYTTPKIKSKDAQPLPDLYQVSEPNWPKAVEKERRPCGFSGADHPCVVLDIPLKASARLNGSGSLTKLLGGMHRVVLDTQTGLITLADTLTSIDNGRTSYMSETVYQLKRQSYSNTSTPASSNCLLPACTK